MTFSPNLKKSCFVVREGVDFYAIPLIAVFDSGVFMKGNKIIAIFAMVVSFFLLSAIFVACDGISGGSKGGSSSPSVSSVWTDKSRPNNSSTVFEGERGKIGDTSVGFYRIPAITLTKDGDLLAFTDKRFGDNMDTGYALTTNAEHTEAVNQTSKAANKRGDITMRVSKDAGKTWGPEITAAKGEYQATPNPPNGIYAGHCDAVPVSDIDNPKNIMFLTCSGSSNYSNNNGPNYLLVFKSTDGGASWTWKDITPDIAAATGNSSTKRFFGAGRACQSKIYQFGSHKRVYAHVGINGSGYVMYTDDFGDNWKKLGNNISGWDEVKISEYDDGSLLVVGKAAASGTTHPLTVWRYGTGTDDAKNGTGTFDANQNISIAGTNCNGDMIIVKAKETASGKTVNLVLASYPMGTFAGGAVNTGNDLASIGIRGGGGATFERWNIGIRWKTFPGDAATLPSSSDFASSWSAKADAYYVQGKGKGDIEGVYSVLQELPNRKIGILYEEGPGTRDELKAGTNIPFKGYKYGDWNVIKYQELDISTITGGKYTSL